MAFDTRFVFGLEGGVIAVVIFYNASIANTSDLTDISRFSGDIVRNAIAIQYILNNNKPLLEAELFSSKLEYIDYVTFVYAMSKCINIMQSL